MISAIASLALTPSVRHFSERYGWLDEPRDNRRVHKRAISRLGGVAIFASVLITLIPLLLVNNLVTQALGVNRAQLFVTLVPATLVFLFGVYDDLRYTNAHYKFIAQGLAGALFYAMGGRIQIITMPFMGSVELHPIIGFILTIVWVVGISNAFNLIDGIDGLAAGAALFATLVLFVVSLITGNIFVTVIALVLCGSLIGFLRYNFSPASIFLGDSGALFIGFVLAALSVQGAQKAATAVAVAIPLLAFGVPIIDVAFTLMRRFIGGRPLFQGDREHIHHMLLARGWSQRRVALILYGVCALFGLTALFLVSNMGIRLIGMVLFVISVAVVLAVGRLRYHEVDEIKASVRRNLALSSRRQRATYNIRIRRASRSISNVKTLEEIFDIVREMLEGGEFVCADLQLRHNSNAISKDQVLAYYRRIGSLQGAMIRNEMICWTWTRGDIDAPILDKSERFWMLHLPLSTERGKWGYINFYREFESEVFLGDINYLCSLFRIEISQAVERALLALEQELPEYQISMSTTGGN
jgi:UDP-GlcNAc:undecaprenyl-phosphate GlcNAc-1-phosphate transferase